MRVLISGASGLVGTELRRQLTELGHQPISLVRRPAKNENEIEWDPMTGRIPFNALDGVDAVVNLAGATTGKIPWTPTYRKEIVDSRIDSTKTLVKAINSAKEKPKVFVSGSASGFYGDSGDTWLTEDSPKGTGFLSDLAAKWEQEAEKADTRVVLARTTLVMSPTRGALARLLPLIKLFVGGPIGSGKQWWAWISLRDEARAIIHLINSDARGAYNLTAPEPATCAQVIQALAKAAKRPALFRIPGWLMTLVFGEAAQELLLCSQKMSAEKLLATGFKFDHPKLQDAAKYSLGL
jgi:uncharacterized protein (TIGR01777 family)